MNLTVRGAFPSSTSESAQASSGATSSSAPLAAPCAVVPGVAGAAGAVEAVGALCGGDPLSPPPPHAATRQAVTKHTMADRIRTMFPPKRRGWRGIVTNPPLSVNSRRTSWQIGVRALAASLGVVCTPVSARAFQTTGELPVLVVLAQFPDCLLYTSDAADERSSVDLGGRRII